MDECSSERMDQMEAQMKRTCIQYTVQAHEYDPALIMSHASVENQDLRDSPVWADVQEYFHKLHNPAFDQIANATDLSATPDGAQIAFTGVFRNNLEDPPRTRICVLHGEQKLVKTLTHGPNNDKLPQWSKNGQQLAFLSDSGEDWAFQLSILQMGKPDASSLTTKVNGSVEYLHWSPGQLDDIDGSLNRTGKHRCHHHHRAGDPEKREKSGLDARDRMWCHR